MEDLDLACFKVLAANDTSNAPGHQAGIVIPAALSDFFPILPSASVQVPTVDKLINADLWIEEAFKETVQTRFQHQTWGGTRSPERRLTSNLGPIRDEANAGDVLLFQRSLTEDARMKLTLVRRGTALFGFIQPLIGGRKWGALNGLPVRNQELQEAERLVADNAARPFQLFSDEVKRAMSRVQRIARDRAFSMAVMKNCEKKCVITGRSIFAPNGTTGLDAAHIVPISLRGSDDVRNGIAMSKELHWAFDRGLIGVDKEKVVVAAAVSRDARNGYLNSFSGAAVSLRGINAPISKEAFSWHLQNIFLG